MRRRGLVAFMFVACLLAGWAHTHAEEEPPQAESKASDEVVGRWMHELGGFTITIRREDGVLVFERQFKDGRIGKFQVLEKMQDGRRRFDRKGGGRYGVYYLINKDGNLESHEREGLVSTARAVK